MQKKEDSMFVIDIIKQWSSPVLVSILGLMIWTGITELKSDVKLLLKEGNVNNTKIQIIQQQITDLQNKLYHTDEPQQYNKNISIEGIPSKEQTLELKDN